VPWIQAEAECGSDSSSHAAGVVQNTFCFCAHGALFTSRPGRYKN
jgi:hypothetical protein